MDAVHIVAAYDHLEVLVPPDPNELVEELVEAGAWQLAWSLP